MIDEYLAKKFALSKKGANNLKKGIVYTTLLDFSLMLPVILFVLFLSQYIPDPRPRDHPFCIEHQLDYLMPGHGGLLFLRKELSSPKTKPFGPFS